MMQNNIKTRKNLYKLGRPLGLNNSDVAQILNQGLPRNEQPSFSAGPDIYYGSWYGTISINDF